MAAPWRAISSPTSTCSALVRDLDRELIASTSIFPGAGERVVDELERQAVGDGGIGVQRLALEQNAQRALTADRPGQEVGAAAAGMEADAGERRAEARSGSHEAEVADEREVQARAYCGSLDRRDRRDLQVEDAEEAAVVGVQRVAEFADRSLEI